ncbi:MAG: PIG-L family deacetylase [Candidatus Eremiobacteraeota bacterium]|nr:PIG-L family deacetylase [Candidatus Eremiobacteraeota bacterium]
MNERILVVGAHPDDVDYIASGTMIKWSLMGKEVYYLVCTDGDKGGTRNDLTTDKLIEMRRSEQRAAAKIVGARDVFFLGKRDGELTPDLELREEIVRIIRKIRPQKVFSFDPANRAFDSFHRYHTDHRAAAIAVFDAVFPAAKNRMYFPHLLEEGLEPHKIDELFFCVTKEPNYWVDISGVIETKIECIKAHKSQFQGEHAGTIENRVRQWCREVGKAKGYAYAEAFRRIAFPY